MFNFLKVLFGGATTTKTVKPIANPPKPQPKYTRGNTSRKDYYLKNGSYYSVEDDSLIEDLILIALLSEMFSDDVESYEAEYNESINDELITDERSNDIAEILAAEESAREAYSPEPVRTPEPSYDSSDSYSSSDSGGSDFGGSD